MGPNPNPTPLSFSLPSKPLYKPAQSVTHRFNPNLKQKTLQLQNSQKLKNKKMKVKTEESVSASKKKINHQSQVDEKESSGNKMFNKSSKLSNKAWSMSSLMEDLPLSASSSFNGDSPTLPCDSCRPSTVFYSPTRFQVFFLYYTPTFFSSSVFSWILN